MSKLQDLRKLYGFTQDDIANKLGISQQAYASYEKEDNATISLKLIKGLSAIYSMSSTDIINFLSSNDLENNTINDFLDKSLTAYHAVKNTKFLLERDGFKELKESDTWNLKQGDKYYISKNNSALIAFKIGDLSDYSFHIAGCHTDSPCLKIKGNSLIDSKEGKKINVEVYGGLIDYSMFDIPLKIAGRIFANNEGKLKEELYESDFNINIPSLCIHHNNTVNDGMKIDNQNDLLPLIGKVEDLYKTLSATKDIVDADLFVVPTVKATYTGTKNEYLVSPRIDNLSSLFSITNGIMSSESKGISVLYATDNEEIGSLSKQGAESSFLPFVLERINKALGKKRDDYLKALSQSFVLSIDNGHATHQAHPEKSDPVQQVYLNNGVVIKHNPHYSTDGYSSAIIKMIAKANDVKVQEYYNNSSIRCGSTIGLVTSAQLAVNACDIGLAQLAMHSAIETVGRHDIEEMTKLVKAFFESKVIID